MVDYPPGPARGQVRYAEAALSDQILQVHPPPKLLHHASDGCQHLKLRRAERDAVWFTGEEAQTRSRHVFFVNHTDATSRWIIIKAALYFDRTLEFEGYGKTWITQVAGC